MKRVLIAAIVAVASMSFATSADAKKSRGATVSCPAGIDSNGCEYYKDGMKAGRGDRAAHQSAAYERHSDHYDSQNEAAFKAGYEKGWGVPARASSAAAPAKAAGPTCPSGMEVNRCEYYKDGFKKGREDRGAHLSDAYQRHSEEYNTEFESYFRQGYEVGWNSGH
jgi:opacity protein-like surface antigen